MLEKWKGGPQKSSKISKKWVTKSCQKLVEILLKKVCENFKKIDHEKSKKWKNFGVGFLKILKKVWGPGLKIFSKFWRVNFGNFIIGGTKKFFQKSQIYYHGNHENLMCEKNMIFRWSRVPPKTSKSDRGEISRFFEKLTEDPKEWFVESPGAIIFSTGDISTSWARGPKIDDFEK
jgi:hypothetical protein